MIAPPILTQASVSLAAGALAQFNSNDLCHPFNQAVLIREIQFSIFYNTASANVGNLGNSIRLSLAIGRVGITSQRAYVPLWNFGKRISELLEMSGAVATRRRNTFSWLLPRPLLVPPRCAITAIATRQQSDFLSVNDAGNAATVRISYSGIAMPKNFKMPDRIDVPFVSAFMDANTGSVGHSNQLDLMNLDNTPLKIQRLIGRCGRLVDTAGLNPTVTQDFLGATPLVRIMTSNKRDIVGTYLPFNEVFDPLGRNLEIRHSLGPQENFDIDLKDKSTGTNLMSPTVSMIGTRSVSVRDI